VLSIGLPLYNQSKSMKKLLLLSAAFAFSMGAFAQTPRTITAARTNDANGIPVDTSTQVILTGVVYGPNQYPTTNGAVFILHDHNMGIKVYSKNNFGYTVHDGDSVAVVGKVQNFKGEAELFCQRATLGDTIIPLGTGHMDSALVITTMTETNESQLIRINGINMSAATGWVTPTRHYFTVTAGAVSMYIDSFMDWRMFAAAKPLGTYDVLGFVTQFVSAPPYVGSGYQINPRSLADFRYVGPAAGIGSIENNWRAVVYPNPSADVLNIYTNGDVNGDVKAQIRDLSGKLIAETNFQAVGKDENLEMNLNTVPSGMYILHLESAGQTLNQKIQVLK